jgi:hypothetical protein
MPSGYPSTTPPGAAVDRLPSYGTGSAMLPVARPRGSGTITAVIGLSLGLAVLVSVIVLRTARRDDTIRTAAAASAAETFTLDLQVTPPSAIIEIDGAVAGTGRVAKALPRDGRSHVLRLSAPGYESLLVEFKETTLPPPAIGLRPIAPAPSQPPFNGQTGASVGQSAPVGAQGGAPGAHRGPAPGPSPTATPAGKTKGSSDARPKTDNIDPWE